MTDTPIFTLTELSMFAFNAVAALSMKKSKNKQATQEVLVTDKNCTSLIGKHIVILMDDADKNASKMSTDEPIRSDEEKKPIDEENKVDANGTNTPTNAPDVGKSDDSSSRDKQKVEESTATTNEDEAPNQSGPVEPKESTVTENNQEPQTKQEEEPKLDEIVTKKEDAKLESSPNEVETENGSNKDQSGTEPNPKTATAEKEKQAETEPMATDEETKPVVNDQKPAAAEDKAPEGEVATEKDSATENKVDLEVSKPADEEEIKQDEAPTPVDKKTDENNEPKPNEDVEQKEDSTSKPSDADSKGDSFAFFPKKERVQRGFLQETLKITKQKR